MSKSIDSLERKIRSRPGAAKRIDARTDAMRSVRWLAELPESWRTFEDGAPVPDWVAGHSPPRDEERRLGEARTRR